MGTGSRRPEGLDAVLQRPAVRRLRELLAERDDVVVLVGDLDGRVLWGSRAGSIGMFRRAPDEYEGQDRFGYVHEDDRERVRRGFARAVAGETVSYTFRAPTDDGRVRLVTSLVWLTDGPAGPVVVTIVLPADAPPEDLAYLTQLAAGLRPDRG